jgi:LmbE family N-acetylglucosaminyl deacetylase
MIALLLIAMLGAAAKAAAAATVDHLGGATLARLEARLDAQERELAELRAQLALAARAGPTAAAAAAAAAAATTTGDSSRGAVDPAMLLAPCQLAPFAWPCPPSIESRQPALPFAQFARVMAVTAHPDDESLGSGTLARLARLGAEVTIVCLTNGDKGTSQLNVTSAALAETRRAELTRAAAALGATAVWLGYEDGGLENTYEARMRVAAQIRLRRPQLLVTFNPQYNFGHFQVRGAVGRRGSAAARSAAAPVARRDVASSAACELTPTPPPPYHHHPGPRPRHTTTAAPTSTAPSTRTTRHRAPSRSTPSTRRRATTCSSRSCGSRSSTGRRSPSAAPSCGT